MDIIQPTRRKLENLKTQTIATQVLDLRQMEELIIPIQLIRE
jgi:hypothetical protein